MAGQSFLSELGKGWLLLDNNGFFSLFSGFDVGISKFAQCPSFKPWSLLRHISLKSLCTSYSLALLSPLRSSRAGLPSSAEQPYTAVINSQRLAGHLKHKKHK